MGLEIVSFEPTSGSHGEYVVLTVTGMDETFTVDDTEVFLGGDRVHGVISVNPGLNTIHVVLDENAHTGKFSIFRPSSLDMTESAGEFTVNGNNENDDEKPFELVSIRRLGGGMEYKPGDEVQINGRNLQAVTALFFGTRAARTKSRTNTRITFLIPEVRPNSYMIKVRANNNRMYNLSPPIRVVG